MADAEAAPSRAVARTLNRIVVGISGASGAVYGARLLQALRELPHAASVQPFGESVHYTDARADADPGAVAEELRRALAGAGFEDADVRPVAPDIEDVFMALMGGAA